MIPEQNLETVKGQWRRQGAQNHLAPVSFMQNKEVLRARDAAIIGAQIPISLQPTPYRVLVKESIFFALSALDCLRLPALLGEKVVVESICPANGSGIQLTLTQEGVASCDPPGCVLSMTVPGMTSSYSGDGPANTNDATYHLMHFFSSAEAARLWLMPYQGVTILTVDQAWRLVHDK